jgi:hypothetical protein
MSNHVMLNRVERSIESTPTNHIMDFGNYSRRLAHVQHLERVGQRCRTDLDRLLQERLCHIREQQKEQKEPPSETFFNVHSLKDIDWTQFWWPDQIVRGSDTVGEKKEEDEIIDDAWSAFLKAKLG